LLLLLWLPVAKKKKLLHLHLLLKPHLLLLPHRLLKLRLQLLLPLKLKLLLLQLLLRKKSRNNCSAIALKSHLRVAFFMGS